MELYQLEAFLAVANYQNFTKAADQLNLVQSSVTARINTLEDHIGKRLFERGTRHVKLTPAGEMLLPYAKKALEVINEGSLRVKSGVLYDDTIKIGGVGSIWNSSIYKQILLFKTQNPRIAMQLITGHSHEVNQKIQEERIDAGFVYLPPKDHGFEVIPFKEETISLIASSSLILEKREVKKEELFTLPYVHYNWGSPFSDWYETEFGSHGLVSLRVDHINLAIKMITELNGIGFLLDGLAKDGINEGKLVPLTLSDIKLPIPRRQIYLVYHKKARKKHALEEFINVIINKKPLY